MSAPSDPVGNSPHGNPTPLPNLSEPDPSAGTLHSRACHVRLFLPIPSSAFGPETYSLGSDPQAQNAPSAHQPPHLYRSATWLSPAPSPTPRVRAAHLCLSPTGPAPSPLPDTCGWARAFPLRTQTSRPHWLASRRRVTHVPQVRIPFATASRGSANRDTAR